ncbi:Sodium/calcium exchanger protein-domain-containing protein [Schizophyllum commune]
MGETCASDVSSNVNSVHARPSSQLPAAVIAEDDDEPPSSGPSHRTPEVTTPREGIDFVNTLSLATDGATLAPTLKTLRESTFDEKKIPFARSATEKVEDDAEDPSGQPQSKTKLILGRLKTLFTPIKPLGPEPTYAASFKATVRYTPLNFCLLFIPVSWALHYTHQSATLIFVFSCLGIIPLAALLGFGTEQVAHRTSSTVGGLLNATLGNVVEMIIAGIALSECKLELVQSSLLGGLLSNMLLVLGMAFIVGGFRFHSQEFQPMVAQLNSSLMTVSVISLIIPAAFHEYLEDRLQPGAELPILLQLSRGSAVLLILIYIGYLVFQFYSHNHLFLDTESAPSPSSEVQHLKLNAVFSLILLVVVTVLCYLTAECLVDSLEGLVEAHPNVSTEWITLIIIPVISNAAEHTTAVIVACKGKFDLAMSVAIGSCIQIALFVIPVLVLVAWGMGKPLTLLFDPLETLVLFFSVILVKFSVEDGKAHWMSGVVLAVGVYFLLALSFWNFPDAPRMLQGRELMCS